MVKRSIAAASPRFTARTAGLFYLLYVVMASLAGLARRGILIAGNAAATSTNIMAHESLYTVGFACDFLSVACYVVVIVLLHQLLKPVNESVSMVAGAFGFLGCILMAVGGVFQLAPLTVLNQGLHSSVFSADQFQVQAGILLKLYNQAYSIALIAFGLFDALIGYLVFKSTFLPRILGVLMLLAGLAFLPFLAPAFGARYLRRIMLFAVGELCFILWLLVRGVDAERWTERALDVSPGS